MRISKEPDERREEIIAAAQKLFEEKGYENTMMSDIARALGISQGLSYRYFKSKQKVLDAVAEKYGQEYLKTLKEITFKPEASAKEKLDIYFSRIADLAVTLKLLPLLHEKDNEDLHRRIAEKGVLSTIPLLQDLIIEGNRQGCFDCPYPEKCAIFLLSGVIGMHGATRVNQTEGENKADQDMEYVLAMFYRVLGVKQE